MDENANASSSVIQPADISTPVQDPATSSEPVAGDTSTPVRDPAATSTPITGDGSTSIVETEGTGDTSEIYTGPYQVTAEVVAVPERPFFTTPFEEYTVTEGLLLLLVVLLVIHWITGKLRGGFSWL